MEKEYQISWPKIIGLTALIAIVIAIICLVYPKENNSLLTQQTYISNITLMKDAGFEYFSGSNLPEEIGDSEKITLDEMITRSLIVEFFDEEGNSCNNTDSYIKTTKVTDDEYEMSIFLSCNNKSDYIITTISKNVEVVCLDCEEAVNTEEEISTSLSDVSVNESQTTNTSNKTTTTSGNSTQTTSDTSSNKSTTTTTSSTTNTTTSQTVNINVTQTTNININNYINNCCSNNDSSSCGEGSDSSSDCLANIYHSVIFDATGGSEVRTQIVKHGSTATYVEPYRYGYEFLGWYLNGEEYDFSTPVTAKITLYAKWEKKEVVEDTKEYVVDFDSNGGSYVSPQEVEEGSVVVKPENPTRDCYDFVGWYIDSELTEKYDFATPVTEDITLYAKWRENDTCKVSHTVKFNSNGGSKVSSQVVEDGKLATKPSNPTRDCYDFVGWYIDSKLTEKYDFATPVTEDITLYAKWRENDTCKNTYTVKFNSNGGSSVKSQEVEEGARATEPTEPTRSGYTFLGWYLNGTEFSFKTRIYEDITLVAKWEKNEEKYYKYCEIVEETYYSISYVSAAQTTSNYSWQVKFDNIKNAQNFKITKVGYLTSTSMYTTAVNRFYNKGISMTSGSNAAEVVPTSGSVLKTYSLKSSNFTPSVGTPYYSNGTWYSRLAVSINNYNNVTSYYASNIKSSIYFVPFYFEVKYTDLNSCKTDKASNASKYSNYEIVETFYK